MLDYLLQYSLFLAEVATLVIAIGVVIGFLFHAIRRAREYTAEHLEVKNLNRRFEQMEAASPLSVDFNNAGFQMGLPCTKGDDPAAQ